MFSTKDLISVIIPVYNVEKYLRQCIESVLNQTYTKIEVILVDDGSTDSSGKICDEYALKDECIEVIHKQNGGISSARNSGIEKCHGEYICFIDSDDYIHAEMLEKLYVAMKEQDVDLSICGIENVYDKDYDSVVWEFTSVMKDEILSSDEAIEKLFIPYGWQYVVAWNKLYKREIFSELRYPNGLIHEDEMVIHRVFDKCKKIATISDELYYYRQRNNSIMSQKGNIKRLDAYIAMADRIEFLYVTNRRKHIKRLAQRYWEEINWKYRYSDKDEEFEQYFKKIQKAFRDVLLICIREIDCNWKEKVSMIIFAISPQLYIKLWG